VRLRIENFEDRSVPSASPLYQDIFIPANVDATDGPMPQTREHVLLARQVGVTTANQGWGSWEISVPAADDSTAGVSPRGRIPGKININAVDDTTEGKEGVGQVIFNVDGSL
jgi:hypothetical protein